MNEANAANQTDEGRTEGAAVCLQSEEELVSSRQPHQSHVLNTLVGPTPVHTHTVLKHSVSSKGQAG